MVDKIKGSYILGFNEGKKSGRQEVIDWITQQELTEPDDDSNTRFYPFYTFFKKDFEDKCAKDWGIRS